jgi:hypothetical protein
VISLVSVRAAGRWSSDETRELSPVLSTCVSRWVGFFPPSVSWPLPQYPSLSASMAEAAHPAAREDVRTVEALGAGGESPSVADAGRGAYREAGEGCLRWITRPRWTSGKEPIRFWRTRAWLIRFWTTTHKLQCRATR